MRSQPTSFDLEKLESRICPSTINFGAVVVTAGNALTDGDDVLIEVTSGRALVFVSDFNNNQQADAGDIVGISVTGGIKLTSFVDIHGDIVTNLNKDGTLSGENHDGSVLLNKANIGELNIIAGTIGNGGELGEGNVDGQILAGGSIGAVPKSFSNGFDTTLDYPIQIDGDVQVIAAGTAAVGRTIFTNVDATVVGMPIGPVILEAAQGIGVGHGPSIQGVSIGLASTLSLIQAGDGGPGGRGGSITDIAQLGSGVDGIFLIRAGDGGDSAKNGGAGGVLSNLSFEGTANYILFAGQGGDGAGGNGGVGGNITNLILTAPSGFSVTAGTGGDGGKTGAAGGSISTLEVGGSAGTSVPANYVLTANFDEDLYLDNNPILDLLTVNTDDGSVSIFLNDGDGNFILSQTTSVGLDPQRAALGDVNNDGNIDVVVSNQGSDTVSVLLGNGDGTLQTPSEVLVGNLPFGIALAQVIGDGSLDIVVTNSGDDTVTITPGRGDGSFDDTAIITLATGSNPRGVTVRDLNPSSSIDIAVTNAGDDTVSVFVQSGTGFQAAQDFEVGGNPADMVSGFVNALNPAILDGIPDLVTADSDDNTVTILFGQGGSPNISYLDPVTYEVGRDPSSLILTNLNGDIRPDIVVTNTGDNTISILLSTGNTAYLAAEAIPVGSRPTSVTSGDYNNDGNIDLVVANSGSASLSVLFGNGDGTFQITGSGAIRAGDGGDGGSKSGGTGGSIGLDPSKATPSDFTPNILLTVGSSLPIVAGSGGDGGQTGGRGGSITSVEATGGGDVTFQAGNGGVGGTKTGGNGGTIGQSLPVAEGAENVFSVVGNGVSVVFAGNAGDGGSSGGMGGQIVNSQFFGDSMDVSSGDGGSATLSGRGNVGGDIKGSIFDSIDTLFVTTGNGGDSAGSSGASGGSVTDSEFTVTATGELVEAIPDPGSLVLTLGDGGAGTAGGNGGSLKSSNFFAIVTEISVGGGFFTSNELVVRLHTGSGGNGTNSGGKGGDMEGIEVHGVMDLLDFEFGTPPNDLIIDMGAGGTGGTGAGGDGGSLSGLHVTKINSSFEINNVDGGTNGRGGDGVTGGAGGKVSSVELLPEDGLVGGVFTAIGGTGGNGTSGNGGRGGDVTSIDGDFEGIAFHQGGGISNGLRLQGGNGGSSTGSIGGRGGDVGGIEVNTGTDNISFIGGNGGQGSLAGGDGGSLSGLRSKAGDLIVMHAGDGGDATGAGVSHIGGDGGSIINFSQDENPGQIIQQIVAGNGGNAFGVGGIGGEGGSVDKIDTLGDIGLFDGNVYGVNGMGGLFAGAGGQGENAFTWGTNGSVTNITADRIATIAAGTAAGPVAASFIDDITTQVLGANSDGTQRDGIQDPNAADPAEFVLRAFDFFDANSNGLYDIGADPLHDPSEVPIDGLVIADVIGTINLPPGTPQLPEDVEPLYQVETSTGIVIGDEPGHLDPHVP